MTKTLGACILAIFLASACGGGSDTLSTGIPPNTSLGNLTPDQAQKLCMTSQMFVQTKLGSATCLTQGLVAAALAPSNDVARMLCKTAYDACVSKLNTSSGSSPDGGTSSTTCKAPPASCTATVGEYETCLNDTSAVYDKALAALPSCDTLTVPLMITSGAPAGVTEPASCTRVDSECPGINGSNNSSSSSGDGGTEK